MKEKLNGAVQKHVKSLVAGGSDGEPLGDPQRRAPSDRLGRVVAGHLRVTYLHPLPFGSR